jgi:hypothetical protein
MRAFLRSIAPEPVRRLVRRLRGDYAAPRLGGMFVIYRSPTPDQIQRCEQVYGDAFRTAFEYIAGNAIQGDFLEFGAYRGYTALMIARLMREFGRSEQLWLYDSFAGLPVIESEIDAASYEVAVKQAWFPGQMAVSEDLVASLERDLSAILPRSQRQIVKGNYANVLPARLPEAPPALIHLDCGLYASSHLVLSTLLERGLLQDGAVLMFSDFNCNRANPQMGDRRALADAFAAQERFHYSRFFSYGWNGQSFLVHERLDAASGAPHSSGENESP